MKKILSLLLVGAMVFSMIPAAYATTDYTNGTQVSFNAEADNDGDGQPDSVESYTVTVPAKLAPAGSGNVVAQGTWASNRKLVVTADPDVTLTNSINAADQKVLTVTFPGIALVGSNTAAVSDTKAVSVADIENALFGTWEGVFEYNVEMQNKLPFIEGALYTGGLGYRFFPQTETSGFAVYYMDYTAGIDDISGRGGDGYVDYIVEDGKYLFEGEEWVFSADGTSFTTPYETYTLYDDDSAPI